MPRFLAASVSMSTRPGPPPTDFDREAAPELELAVDLEGLAAIDRNEAHALLAHPDERVEAARDQKLDQVGIGAVLRHPRHVVEELVRGVGAEIGGVDLALGEVGHQRLDVVDAVVDDAHRAGGETAVAAGFVFRRGLQHQHLGALLLRRQRRAERRIAGTDHDDVIIRHCPSDAHIRSYVFGAVIPHATRSFRRRDRPTLFHPVPRP